MYLPSSITLITNTVSTGKILGMKNGVCAMNMLSNTHENKQTKPGCKNYKPPNIKMFNKKESQEKK